MSSDRHHNNGDNRVHQPVNPGPLGGGDSDQDVLFRDLIESSPDLVFCLSPTGEIFFANATAHCVLGFEAGQLSGRTWTELLGDESRREYERLADKLIEGATVGPVELTLCDARGEQLTVEAKLNCRFEEGRPAWFRAVLRDLRSAADAQAQPAAAEQPEMAKPCILVVEDDDISAHMLSRLLEGGGYRTDRAATGAEALEKLAERDYDAMTLDLALPDQDGVDLLHKIRAGEETADLPVIVVSASADETRQRLSGDAANVADWLNKPIAHDSLRSALTRAVDIGEGRMPRVLHVEDDEAFSAEVRSTLADVAKTERASTLAEARRKLQEDDDYDLILLDLTLPDGLGAELLPFLNRPQSRSVPVILVSSSDATDALAAHVADTLNKSDTNQQQMLDTIRAHLRR